MKENERIENVLKGAEAFFVASDKGCTMTGRKSEIENIFVLFIASLKKAKFSPEEIALLTSVGLALSDEKDEEDKKIEKEINENIKKLMKILEED